MTKISAVRPETDFAKYRCIFRDAVKMAGTDGSARITVR